MQLIALDEGAPVPRDPRNFSGLCFMGGPMSVNDELPWIAPALELIREAVRKDVPVIGHCLGGQLMSRALGGVVRANPYKEIGWGVVRVADNGVAREWLGELQAFHPRANVALDLPAFLHAGAGAGLADFFFSRIQPNFD